VLLTLGFAAADLARLRLRIGLGALDAGLDADRTADFVLAVNEMAENAIVHGGGQGRLLLATEDGDLQCSITDSGPGFRQRPAPGPELTGPGTAAVPDGHRGIPLARQLTDSLHIATTGAGTTVTVLVRVG
jgi:anti-sigma regulatory factor (Ser/Thr protein kinase)